MLRRASPLCLFLLLAAPLFAADSLANPGLYDYAGDLDGEILFGLTLHQRDGQKLTGSYFYKRSLKDKRAKAANEQEFLKNYDRIFSPKFVSRIRAAVPHNMFARDQGIMLADGAVWFDDKGKVFALNN